MRRLALALATVYVVWGSTYLAMKVAVETLPPFFMAASRYLMAGLTLYLLLRARGAKAPTAKQWAASAFIGALTLVVGNALLARAEQHVPSNVCAVLYGSIPLWASFMSFAFGQRLKRAEWAGIGLGLLGVVALNLGGDFRSHPAEAALVLVGAAGLATGSVWMKRVDLPKGAMGPAAQLCMAGLMMVVASLATGEPVLDVQPSGRSLAALGYLTGVGSLVAYPAYAYVQLHARPALATSNAYVNPLVAMLLGALLGGELLGATTLVGAVLILAALGLTALLKRDASPRQVPAPAP
ncbi:MAG: drug/metabolite exporter YedA [Myxococcaceae bacterium]|nr:drug/metabolite exporter YedA [Myxococcaceae bacterium]